MIIEYRKHKHSSRQNTIVLFAGWKKIFRKRNMTTSERMKEIKNELIKKRVGAATRNLIILSQI